MNVYDFDKTIFPTDCSIDFFIWCMKRHPKLIFTFAPKVVKNLIKRKLGKMPAYLEYVNFQANAHKFFLRLAEQGTRPCFLLTMEDPIELQNTNSSDIYSARWDLYRVTLAMWYSQLKELHESIGGASITRV